MASAERQFVSCHVGNSLFGIDVLLVREINRSRDIVHVDLAPPAIEGLMNLRGQIVAVQNLAKRLGMDPSPATDATRVIVLKTDRELTRMRSEGLSVEHTAADMMGILVDEVGDLVVVDTADVLPAPTNVGDVEGQYLSGVVRLEKGLMAVLQIDALLEMRAARQEAGH